MNIFKRIFKWVKDRNLITGNFNHQLEVSFIIEELLESTGKFNSESARNEAKIISNKICNYGCGDKKILVDSFGDIVVYATGAIAKLGYDPEKVLGEILKEIESRKGTIVDGKWKKYLNTKTYKANFKKCLIKKK